MQRKNKDINVNRPTFCILPWLHLQTKPNGQVKPCCRFNHTHEEYKTEHGYVWDNENIKNKSLTEIINSDVWRKLRQDMLAGKNIPGCSKCYNEEHKGNPSMRTGENDIWFRDLPNENPIDLKYFEFALGSFCNLKCRTCDASLSHTWKDDNEKIKLFYDDRYDYKDNTNLNVYYKDSDLANVEVIKFTGGEPMLHPNFVHIIDSLIKLERADKVTLNIFTNCSWMPKETLLDKLKKFKKITISVSIDGIGKVNDYIRNPSVWSSVETTLKTWLAQPFDIVWNPTFSVYNIWQATEMVDWWLNIQQEVKRKDFWPSITRTTHVQPRKNLLRVLPTEVTRLNMVSNCVTKPAYLSCSLFPSKDIKEKLQSKKDELIERLNGLEVDDFSKKSLKHGIKKFFSQPMSLLDNSVDDITIQTFGSYTSDLDMLRQEKLQDSIPEVYNLFPKEIFKGRLK